MKLKRDLSLLLLILYGIGTIVGAGIYVLVGKVVGISGHFAPLSFVVSGIIAAFSALSYAKLSSYMPDAGGEFIYVSSAFKFKVLSVTVAIFVMFIGIISAATIARGFIGYFQTLYDIPSVIILLSFISVIGLIAMLGIKYSVKFIALFSILEVCGLLFIIIALRKNFVKLPDFLPSMFPSDVLNIESWNTIFQGAFLAFFAFIGFEDMVNIAEEVKSPRRNMPLGIIFALIFTMTLYILVSLSAALTLPVGVLKNTTAPMAELIKVVGYSPKFISIVSLFSISNGAIVQIIMAARVLMSMARREVVPRYFSYINPTTGTPVNASILVTFIIAIFAFAFPIENLAKFTSAIVLIVFSIINLSLLIVEGRRENKIRTKMLAGTGCGLSVLLLFVEIFNLIN